MGPVADRAGLASGQGRGEDRPGMMRRMKTIIEPFRIRMVEPLHPTSPEQRRQALEGASWNLFGLRARDVLIDLLTDSGTGAMSTKQWAALMTGDESYAGSESFHELEETVRELTGFEHVIPTHQGRAAEHLVFGLVGGPGKTIPNNSHFDTTRANVEAVGSVAVDLTVEEAREPGLEAPFKGNIDLGALESLLAKAGPGEIPIGMLTVTNNTAGGQPVSLANMRAASELYRSHGVPFFLDAARFAENAFLIREREEGQAGRPVGEIVHEMFSLADGCMISAKKDGLVNIGGLIALNDDALATQLRQRLVLYEGFPTYGGLAGRDLAALAQGLREVGDEKYLTYRHASANYLAGALEDIGVPTVKPTAIHAVYVDAGRLLPHLSPGDLPGQALACALYLEGGIRAVEIGTLMFGGPDPHSGEERFAEHELVRLTLPRRVYTQSHFDWIIESFSNLAEAWDRLPPYRITEQAPWLRAFTAKLRPES
jgi:tryptophanase